MRQTPVDVFLLLNPAASLWYIFCLRTKNVPEGSSRVKLYTVVVHVFYSSINHWIYDDTDGSPQQCQGRIILEKKVCTCNPRNGTWFVGQIKKKCPEITRKIDPWFSGTHLTRLNVMFSESGQEGKQTMWGKKRPRRGVRPSWAGGRGVQMLQRSGEADNVLPRLPPGPDYSGAFSSGPAPSWFCRDQLSPPPSP